METSAPHTPHWGAPAARWGEKPWVKLLPQRVSCRNQRLEPAEPEWPGECAWGQGLHAKQRTRSWGGSQVWGGRGGGREREEGEGLSTGEAGRRPRPGAIKEVDPTTRPGGWRGARALPSPPTHQALARLAARGPGAAQGAGPPLQQTSPSFPSAHSPPRVGTSLPTALPSPRLSSPGGLLGSTNPVLTFVSPLPSPHSLLLTSPGFLDFFKKNPSTCHRPSTAQDTAQAPWPHHPPRSVGTPLPSCVPCPSCAPYSLACGSLLCVPQPAGHSDQSGPQAGRQNQVT